MACFKVLLWHLPGKTDESHENAWIFIGYIMNTYSLKEKIHALHIKIVSN